MTISDSGFPVVPPRFALVHFWLGFSFLLEQSKKTKLEKDRLADYTRNVMVARGEDLSPYSSFHLIEALGDALWTLDRVAQLNFPGGPQYSLTPQGIQRAQSAFAFLLDVAYSLRETGFVQHILPAFDSVIPDNRTADEITMLINQLELR